MKIKMCDHIDVSGIRIEASQSVYAICTVNENQFVTYSCKNALMKLKS